MLFTTECAACGEAGPALCRRCRFRLAACPRNSTGDVVAALPYGDVTRSLVHALKYRNGRRLGPELAQLLARRLHGVGVVPGSVDVVTWAPTSDVRRRRRGYDQAELVARSVARLLGVPARRLLHRAHGEPQTGRSRSDRLVGPGFHARPGLHGRRILVVDDVVTTGATLHAAAHALREAGAAAVVLAAVAAVGESPARLRPVPGSRRPRLALVHGGVADATARRTGPDLIQAS